MPRQPGRWSGEQAVVVAAGAVTVLGFLIDRLAIANSLIGEPWLGGILSGGCLLIFGLGWRYLEARWRRDTGDVLTQVPLSTHTRMPAPGTSGDATAEWISEKLAGVTGETLVRDALSPAGDSPFGVDLPLGALADTKLAEVALLRRLLLLSQDRRPLRQSTCNGILSAGGIGVPEASLLRLSGRGLIVETWNGEMALTASGAWTASDFAVCLMHDPILVAAYHKVTLAINQTIRVDGKPLTPGSFMYDAWLRPPARTN